MAKGGIKGRGNKGRGKGKGQRKRPIAGAVGRKGAGGDKSRSEGISKGESEEEDDVFWRPTWNTLGPLEAVRPTKELNKLGRKRKLAIDFGLGICDKPPTFRPVKRATAEDAAAEPPKNNAQRRRAEAQRRRRHRKLALQLGPEAATLALPTSALSPEPASAVAAGKTPVMSRTGKRGVKPMRGVKRALRKKVGRTVESATAA